MSCGIITTWPKVHISEGLEIRVKGFHRNQVKSTSSWICASTHIVMESGQDRGSGQDFELSWIADFPASVVRYEVT